jgi:nucleoid-associated protein EbfC
MAAPNLIYSFNPGRVEFHSRDRSWEDTMPDFPFDLSKLDLGKMLGMARDLKERMEQLEQSLGAITVEAMVGGGMVTVRANARGELISITLDPELIAMNDKAMLESLILTGTNQALAQAKARREEEMRSLTGGMAIPGMF